MPRLLVTLFLITAFCFGAALSYYNWTTVPFHYLAGQFELPLIALLLAAFLLGIVVALLLNVMRIWTLHRENRRLRKQLSDAEAELKGLRNLPLGASSDRKGSPAPAAGKELPAS